MIVSLFQDEFDSHPKALDIPWPEFAQGLATHDFTRTTKRGLPCFSPAEFEAGAPRKELRYVLRVHFGVLDLDDVSDQDLERVLGACTGLAFVVYSSWSHPGVRAETGKSRIRVVVPFSRPVAKADWSAFWPRMVARLGGICDEKCKDATRVYFGAFAPPGTEAAAVSAVVEGAPLDVDLLMSGTAPSTPSIAGPRPVRKVKRDRLEKIAERWKRSKSEDRRELGDALLALVNGDPYADPGDRDETLFRVCQDLAKALPTADPESIADAFALSLERTGDDPAKDRAKVIEKLSRAQAGADTRNLPPIAITADIASVTDQAVQALARTGDIYRRGDALVRVVRDAEPPKELIREPGTPTIQVVPSAAIREKLSSGARWIAGEVETLVPTWIVDSVLARSSWPGVRPLEAVAEAPVLRPSGTVLDVPGYDAATGILYEPAAGQFPAVPEAPSSAQLAAAVATLRDVVSDFRFEDPAHEAGWFAAVLTPLARSAFAGACPLFLFDASTPGSGKGLLAKVAALISIGRYPSIAQFPKEEGERRKAITSYAIAGERIVSWDNLHGRLGGQALCTALTEPEWSDRVLGASRSWTGPMRIVWYATSNNAQLGADMDRRVVHVRIDPGCDRPELRSGFRHPDLLAHVRTNRPILTVAALTLLRAYLAAGMPAQQFEPWGSFEPWANLVIGAIRFAGLADPGAVRGALQEADPEAEHMRALVHGWGALGKVTVREALEKIYPGGAWERPFPELAEAIEGLLYLSPREVPTAVRLSGLLRRLAGRRFEGRAIVKADTDRSNNVVRWWVQELPGIPGIV